MFIIFCYPSHVDSTYFLRSQVVENLLKHGFSGRVTSSSSSRCPFSEPKLIRTATKIMKNDKTAAKRKKIFLGKTTHAQFYIVKQLKINMCFLNVNVNFYSLDHVKLSVSEFSQFFFIFYFAALLSIFIKFSSHQRFNLLYH